MEIKIKNKITLKERKDGKTGREGRRTKGKKEKEIQGGRQERKKEGKERRMEGREGGRKALTFFMRQEPFKGAFEYIFLLKVYRWTCRLHVRSSFFPRGDSLKEN